MDQNPSHNFVDLGKCVRHEARTDFGDRWRFTTTTLTSLVSLLPPWLERLAARSPIPRFRPTPLPAFPPMAIARPVRRLGRIQAVPASGSGAATQCQAGDSVHPSLAPSRDTPAMPD